MNEMWAIHESKEIDRLFRECDKTSMEMPNLEANPLLLISKVSPVHADNYYIPRSSLIMAVKWTVCHPGSQALLRVHHKTTLC